MSYALHVPILRACTCLQYVFLIKVTCMFLDTASFTRPLADVKETQGSRDKPGFSALKKIIGRGLKKTGADNVLATQEKVQTQSLEETAKDLFGKVENLQSQLANVRLEKDEALEKLRSDSAASKKEEKNKECEEKNKECEEKNKECEEKNARIEELDKSLANASTRIARLLEETKDLIKQLAEAGSADPEPKPGTSRQTLSAAARGGKEKGKENKRGQGEEGKKG